MNTLIRNAIICLIPLFGTWISEAQEVSVRTIVLDKEILPDSSIFLHSITNESSADIRIYINRKEWNTKLKPGESTDINKQCTSVRVSPVGRSEESISLWMKPTRKAANSEPQNNAPEMSEKAIEERQPATEINEEQPPVKPLTETNRRQETWNPDQIAEEFRRYIENNAYFSAEALASFREEIKSHINKLNSQEDKNAYIAEQGLNEYLLEAEREIRQYRAYSPQLMNTFLLKYDGLSETDRQACLESMRRTVELRLTERETALQALQTAMPVNDGLKHWFDKTFGTDLLNLAIMAGAILLLILWLTIVLRRKKQVRKPVRHSHSKPASDDSPMIVVRRKTTSILKAQNLEDVVNNPNYWRIDTSDFCQDSAVRRIYIKDTCIKEIYNMYADDLRNPNNPKEDGCMVVGRWVHDAETDEYYVSLEHIVLPGDDAVFKEYELNFGGKIKLRVADKLRKLRRDTNLQYDLTCWVHSHPGLGVFFSNSDSSVQMQLKHPTHPKFLTAIVVDILTPQQEFGIFTFRHDATINSKQDIKRLYSLEELYQWAVKRDRKTFRPEDHLNTLAKAECRTEACYGIELSNGAIIDICRLATEQSAGLTGWIHGYSCKNGGKTEHVVKVVSTEDTASDSQLLGCFLIGLHCSIPSLRKACSKYVARIGFVLFYSTTTGILTSIPVIDGQLTTDGKFYGENLLEDLKIWTRRKR